MKRDRTALESAAAKVAGLRYDAPAAKAVLDHEDWDYYYPVVDSRGILTGEIRDQDEMQDYLCVADLVCIARDDLTEAQCASVRDDGSVIL